MKVVFLAAIGDLCHRGHINLLKKMKETGRRVIVIVHDDRSCYQLKGKIPIQSLEKRMSNFWVTGLVDEVIPTYATDPGIVFESIIKKYPDCIYMRGDDTKDFPGKHILEKYNVPIKYVEYTKGVSSTLLREELLN